MMYAAWLFVLVLIFFLVRCVWLNYYKRTWPWDWKRKKISIDKIKNWPQLNSTAISGVVVLTAKQDIWQVRFARPTGGNKARLYICQRRVWKKEVALRELIGGTFFLCLDQTGRVIPFEIDTMSVYQARILGIPIY